MASTPVLGRDTQASATGVPVTDTRLPNDGGPPSMFTVVIPQLTAWATLMSSSPPSPATDRVLPADPKFWHATAVPWLIDAAPAAAPPVAVTLTASVAAVPARPRAPAPA